MERKFIREIGMKEMAAYLLRKWWVIFAGCLLAGVLPLAIPRGGNSSNLSPEPVYDLEDGSYVFATLINIQMDPLKPRNVSIDTCMGLMLSYRSIEAVIEEMKLPDNYIDIFNKMTWSVIGDNIKFTISSPFREADGYSWEEVLLEIVNKGTSVVMENYENVEQVRIIDEPYLQNALITQTSDSGPTVNTKTLFAASLIGGVLICAGLLMLYLLREDIMCGEEIEKNLDIPVLAIIDRKKNRVFDRRR